MVDSMTAARLKSTKVGSGLRTRPAKASCSATGRRGTDETPEQGPELCRRHGGGLVRLRGRPVGIVLRLPVGPGQYRGEALATLVSMPLIEAVLVTPGLRSECLLQLRADHGREEEEVDLVRVLVLNRGPGEAAGVEQVGIEPD